MKLKFFFLIFCFFALYNNDLLVSAKTNEINTILESRSSSENQKDKYKKIKETLTKIFKTLNKNSLKEKPIDDFLNDKETQEFDLPKNDSTKSTVNGFLLKVIVPIAFTGVIFYLLNHYYKFIIQSAWPECLERKNIGLMGLWKGLQSICSIDFGQKWKSFLSQAFEILIAIARFHTIGKKTNKLLVDVLRITSSSLFLVNKEQFSLKAFKQGACYTQGWLIYDVFHLFKKFYDDAKPKEVSGLNLVSYKKDVQYKKTRKFLCTYILPFAESAAALYLSLHITETPDSIEARKSMQAIYSMLRILPIYIKSNLDAIDVLLAVHLLIVFLDFGQFSSISESKFKADSSNKINPDKNGPKCDLDNKTIEEINESQEVEITKEQEPDAKQTEYNEVSSGQAPIEDKPIFSVPAQNNQTEKKFIRGAFLNVELFNELEVLLAKIFKISPDLEPLVNDVNFDSLYLAQEGKFDSRGLQAVLKEKLAEIEVLISKIEP